MIVDGERMRETDDEEGLGQAPPDERSWGDRIAEAAAQAGDLLRTRAEIFREEAAVKAAHAARGAAGMAIAIGLARRRAAALRGPSSRRFSRGSSGACRWESWERS
jgi:hypothetical protein